MAGGYHCPTLYLGALSLISMMNELTTLARRRCCACFASDSEHAAQASCNGFASLGGNGYLGMMCVTNTLWLPNFVQVSYSYHIFPSFS